MTSVTMNSHYAPRPSQPGRGRQGVIVLGTLVGIVALSVLLLLDRVLQPDAFPVGEVRFTGSFDHVTHAELEKVVIPAARGNIFALDLDRVALAAQSIPWVERARVRRQWPRGLVVEIQEQHLVARWSKRDWLNQYGELVSLGNAVGSLDVPSLKGPDGTAGRVLKQFRDWQKLLMDTPLTIESLRLSPRHAWDLVIGYRDVGIDGSIRFQVRLGATDASSRLDRFVRVFDGVLTKYANAIKAVDLRYPNGFSVRWVAGSAGQPFDAKRGSGSS